MKVTWKKTADGVSMAVAGAIREDDAETFETLAADLPGGPLIIDMDRVEHINSVGCSHWVRFVRARLGQGEVTLVNCHEGVVTYANLLPAFGEGVELRTVYFPLRCPGCRKNATKLVDVASLGGDPEAVRKQIAGTTCAKCGTAVEAAADPEDFLEFMNKPGA